MSDVKLRNLLNEAATLMSCSGENPEYDRALVEVCTFMSGLSGDDAAITERVLKSIKNEHMPPRMGVVTLKNHVRETGEPMQ